MFHLLDQFLNRHIRFPMFHSLQLPIRISFRLQRSFWRLLWVCLGLSVALSLCYFPVHAQTAITQATITEILDSNQVYIQNNPARLREIANRGQRVSTRQARTQLQFNNGAVARLSQNAVLTVGQCAQLQRGALLINGAANGCTASVTAGVRGTTYLIEVDEAGQENIKVLEGEVVVTRQSNPAAPSSPGAGPQNRSLVSQFFPRIPIPRRPSPSPTPTPAASPTPTPSTTPSTPAGSSGDRVVLSEGQSVSARQGQPLGPIRRLTQQDFNNILSGNLFNGYASQIPGINRVRESFQRLFPGVPFPISIPNVPVPLPVRPGLPLF